MIIKDAMLSYDICDELTVSQFCDRLRIRSPAYKSGTCQRYGDMIYGAFHGRLSLRYLSLLLETFTPISLSVQAHPHGNFVEVRP